MKNLTASLDQLGPVCMTSSVRHPPETYLHFSIRKLQSLSPTAGSRLMQSLCLWTGISTTLWSWETDLLQVLKAVIEMTKVLREPAVHAWCWKSASELGSLSLHLLQMQEATLCGFTRRKMLTGALHVALAMFSLRSHSRKSWEFQALVSEGLWKAIWP